MSKIIENFRKLPVGTCIDKGKLEWSVSYLHNNVIIQTFHVDIGEALKKFHVLLQEEDLPEDA